MACQGALVLEKLVSGGYLSPEKIPPMKKISEIWEKRDEVLENFICSDCPFKPEDCDFQSPDPAPDLEPCGGYILLALLKENGLLDMTALKKVTNK